MPVCHDPKINLLFGNPGRIWTYNPQNQNLVLCQLSYEAILRNLGLYPTPYTRTVSREFPVCYPIWRNERKLNPHLLHWQWSALPLSYRSMLRFLFDGPTHHRPQVIRWYFPIGNLNDGCPINLFKKRPSSPLYDWSWFTVPSDGFYTFIPQINGSSKRPVKYLQHDNPGLMPLCERLQIKNIKGGLWYHHPLPASGSGFPSPMVLDQTFCS